MVIELKRAKMRQGFSVPFLSFPFLPFPSLGIALCTVPHYDDPFAAYGTWRF